MHAVLINPPAARLGAVNAILTGRGRRYHVPAFPGPLSLKSVVSGAATWTTRERFALKPGQCLLLNDGQVYDITIESRDPVETFCVFFERGLVENACRAESAEDNTLLDDPWTAPPVGFYERIHPSGTAVMPALDAVRLALNSAFLEDRVFDLAGAIAGWHVRARREWTRIPGKRPSTREEIYRRLLRGRDYLESSTPPVRLGDAARAACLSAYHFHRLYTAVFGETPHRFLMRLRLERAVNLLERTDRQITGISLECGFATPSAFSNAIRQAYGTTPTQIRGVRTHSK